MVIGGKLNMPDQKEIDSFIANLTKGVDYGEVSGKLMLFKPGADKLKEHFELVPDVYRTDSVIDFANGFMSFTYRAIIRDRSGRVKGDSEGSCNTEESKYKYEWVKEEDLQEGMKVFKVKNSSKSEYKFAIDQAKTSGDYGKPAEYWQKFKDAIADGTVKKITVKSKDGKDQIKFEIASHSYQIKNPDIFGFENTLKKMAAKRAYVSAVIMALAINKFEVGEDDHPPTKKPIPEPEPETTGTTETTESEGKETEFTKARNEKLLKDFSEALPKCENLDDIKGLFDKYPDLKKEDHAFHSKAKDLANNRYSAITHAIRNKSNRYHV